MGELGLYSLTGFAVACAGFWLLASLAWVIGTFFRR